MLRKSFYFSTLVLLLTCAGHSAVADNNQKSDNKSQKVKLIPVNTFKNTDIGNPALAGSVKILKDGFDITAGGADIWGVKDEFNFVYIEMTGNFDIVTRIESLSAPHLYTKAGIMAREDLNAGSRHIYFQVFPNNNPRNKNNGGYEFQYRQQTNGEMKAIYPASAAGTPEFPVAYPNTWVRLQRINNEFTGYYSNDGKNWKVFTSYMLDLPSKLFLGLAVTSHNVKESAAASFRETGEIKH
jgi:hypothetical protein